MKIKITYEDDAELDVIFTAIKPYIEGFKINLSDKYAPYKHCYITTKKGVAPRK